MCVLRDDVQPCYSSAVSFYFNRKTHTCTWVHFYVCVCVCVLTMTSLLAGWDILSRGQGDRRDKLFLEITLPSLSVPPFHSVLLISLISVPPLSIWQSYTERKLDGGLVYTPASENPTPLSLHPTPLFISLCLSLSISFFKMSLKNGVFN